ncbi:ThuA domain-containing protein [Flavilitoribacter nigricans]|uniref:Crp/Fnr family transcriptional regulator n=1 Tax=Flavilitoribacter nigricans (strain ATCC 23147 / DSM 23189 / NBRC 102662 / NCIMB 1420 / SS-2) TaxID=1122177 RepID=A0A2D0N6S8_FLAN2|nr:ThuA domain-containing protein [Flavilitoribacter nigricans]PHN04204.1 Crp/Fnr family transcriptional regulator [Flavilitoribacter nigricans DSM 23189 = NBRC 102662]
MKNLFRLTILALAILLVSSASAQRGGQFRALLFTKTAGFHHESINEGVTAIRKLGERHHFSVSWQENASVFNDRQLENFDVVIFLNTTGDVLNDEQQAAFEKFIQAGKGFVGIHSASDTEYEWEWYTKMVGHMFKIHPQIQTAKLQVIDRNFPGLSTLPDEFLWTDEWYQFSEATIDDLNYIIKIDESSYDPNVKWGDNVGEGMGDMHPMAWYHEYDGGRAFYTGLGHVPAVFEDPMFLAHLYGGIYWAAKGMGVKKM